jgi:predicted methyltransferase
MSFVKNGLLLLMVCSAASCATSPKVSSSLPKTVSEAVDSTYRTVEHRARDKYRHPLETLQFFGLQPSMTVIEVWPSAGWYAEILAPLLTTEGHYIAAVDSGVSAESKAHQTEFKKITSDHPEVKVSEVEFNPPTQLDIAPAGSVDMILTFRNFHNWMSKKGEGAALESFFTALKPGGILGIVEHRGDSNKPQSKQSKGYVREDLVVKLAKKAGFVLVGKSEINANPRDTKNYPKGVWTLPPNYAEGEKNRDRYMQIGESDRMTLKFMKPR